MLALLFACGSRTGLGVVDVVDAPDASTDAAIDVRPARDAAAEIDAVPDALPPIDARPGDADRTDCPDASDTLVYLIANDNRLLSFHPPTAAVRPIGTIACPNTGGETPFSMAVDRKGVAYVLFSASTPGSAGGRVYRVSTATAACVATPFQPGQGNFRLFGMGFVALGGGPTDTLFIAGSGQRVGDAEGLATLDLTSFRVNPIGNFAPVIQRAELTGTGDGRLFGFYTKPSQPNGSVVGEINPLTAQVFAESPLPNVDQGNGWAFAAWGGDFYLFTGAGARSPVWRFRPSDGTVAQVAIVDALVVGAGVSTCAPQG
jgi:hypothetical protein